MDAATNRYLLDLRMKQHDAYVSLLFKLSCGALALSIVFVRNLTGAGDVQWLWLLGAAWVLWILSLVCLLLASLNFMILTGLRIASLYDDNEPESERQTDRAIMRESRKTASSTLAWSGYTFVLGAVATVVFVLRNLAFP